MVVLGACLRRLLVSVLLLGCFGPAAAEPAAAESAVPVGQVVRQQGSVTVLRRSGGGTLQLGAPVFQGDSILTGPGSKIRIAFADGSALAVGTDSEVQLDEYAVAAAGPRRAAFLTLLRGIVRAVVAGADGSGDAGAGPFDIGTRLAVASARSTARPTESLIEAARDRTSVFVAQGSVAVQGAEGGAGVLLPAGYGTDVLPGQTPNPAKRWSAARVEQAAARTRLP